MRDEGDTGTGESGPPGRARRGRPSILGRPLTDAERAARYRTRKWNRMREVIDDLKSASDSGLLEVLKYSLPETDKTRSGAHARVVAAVVAELSRRFPPSLDSAATRLSQPIK